MVSYGLLDAMLGLVGLASTVFVIVRLVSTLQPLFERVKDSCRAGQPPEGRTLLLWSVFLILAAWVAAAALYFRNLFTLWDCMGSWLESKPTNRPVYALLHLYLFFLLVCGFYGCAITVAQISQNRQVLSNLFMIARSTTRGYQTVEDLEAQRSSSPTDRISAEAEIPSAVGNVRNTSPLPQEDGGHRNGQELNESVTPGEACGNESEQSTEEDDWPGSDYPFGEVLTRTVYSPIRSVKRSSRSTDGVWNNSEPVSSLNQHNLTLDSDGDTMTMTPSSSSSNASSGIDEVEYVDDDNDRYGRQGVRLREPLQDRKRRNTNASHISDQRGNVKEEDDDSSGLYYATPRLNPQNQNAKTELEPLNIGEPPSPCDSCSSAHAEMIPFAKRSPLRVPISPTSPTADAEDADTETTDIERKLRERKTRNSTISAAQSPHTNRVNTTRTLPPSNTNILMSGIDFKFRNHEITEASLRVQIQAAHAHIARMSGRPSPNPNPPPISAPHSYLHPTPIPPPLAQPDDREAGLFWRSREADRRSRAAAPRDGFANDPASSSSDGTVTIDARTGMRRRVGSAPMSSPRLKRPATPYPPAEGWQGAGPEEGKRVRGLVVEIPEKGVGV